jgi:hypothetical protein
VDYSVFKVSGLLADASMIHLPWSFPAGSLTCPSAIHFFLAGRRCW